MVHSRRIWRFWEPDHHCLRVANTRFSVQSVTVKIARDLELRLERFVDGLSAALFRGRMHPVDLANRLIRYVDLDVDEGTAGPTIANDYRVKVNPGELDPALNKERLEGELVRALAETAAEQGWSTGGPLSVHLEADPAVIQGSISCEATHVPGSLHPWCLLIDRSGRALEIGDNRVVIGRGDDADVRVDHPRISRRHALLFRSEGSTWIEDLGSANGTEVNGNPLAGDPIEIRPGDRVSLGPTTFSFRLL